MLAVLLCLAALFGAYNAAKKSPVLGLLTLLLFGYCYGILRANVTATASYFIFDCALLGFYLGFDWQLKGASERLRTSAIRTWTAILMIWPCVMCLMPFQPILVAIVGLRAAIIFLPMLLVGCRMTGSNMKQLAVGVASLNILAAGFGLAEFQLGVPSFYPYSAATQLIYVSADGAGHLRIPGTFSNAHAFAGTLLMTLPLLLGAWIQPKAGLKYKLLMVLGIASAMTGIILASTRMNFVLGCLTVAVALLTSPMGMKNRVIWVLLLASAGAIISGNARFSRFKQVDASTVTERVGGSVNRSFVEVLEDYPLGNGMGGGGTAMPYFLQNMIQHPVAIENEYGRILLEQGILGLAIWVSFIFWFGTRRTAFAPTSWKSSRRLYLLLQLVSLASASIGVGGFQSIPSSVISLLMMGWISSKPAPDEADESSEAGVPGASQIRSPLLPPHVAMEEAIIWHGR